MSGLGVPVHRPPSSDDNDQAEPTGQKAQRLDQFSDPVKALIAVHPRKTAIAVAVGNELRVLDRARGGELRVLLAAGRPDMACIRSVDFDPSGRWLGAGGDDKSFRVWSCESWECTKTLKGPKKISAVTFSKDGSVVLAADKFGDVLVAPTCPEAGGTAHAAAAGQPSAAETEPRWELLLGHYCSIVTSITLSSDGRFVATTDRDMKVRVSVMPVEPLCGAHSIQSYGLGHTAFVTCAVFARAGDKEVLLSGGGDGTLRMWDHMTGRMLCTVSMDGTGPEVPVGEGAGKAAEQAAPCCVLAVAAEEHGRHAAAVVDGRDELCVLSLDVAGGNMHLCGWYSLPGLRLLTDVCFDSAGIVWAVGGPPTPTSVSACVVCGTISADSALVLAADALGAGEQQKLEARDGTEGEAVPDAPGAGGRPSHVAGYLRKRQFTQDEAVGSKRLNRLRAIVDDDAFSNVARHA